MPITSAPSDDLPDGARLRLHLKPYKSLTPEGFVWFIGATSILISLPLFSVLGTAVFWGLLPFLCAAIWGTWRALTRSWARMDLYEEVTLWPDRVRIERHEPRRPLQDWEANPYWVTVHLHERGGPVPQYLTLRGGGREVELGAFLTPSERLGLKRKLEAELRAG